MNKKYLGGLALLLIVLIGMTWRNSNSNSGNETQDSELLGDFEERHAEEMTKKEEKTSELVGDVSPTVSLLMPESEIDIATENVAYYGNVEGFLAYPTDNVDAPGVVVIHEWRGLNDHIKDMARVLAMNGYRALAVDLYNGEVAGDSDQARELSSALEQEVTTANLLAAEDYLRQSSPRVASLGWCLGGKQSLELSLASESLDSTVIYYGRLYDDPILLANINQPVLGIFAENDGGIPPEAVAAFTAALAEAGVSDIDVTVVPGVDHAFANPTGGNYSKQETIDARKKTLAFLQETLVVTE